MFEYIEKLRKKPERERRKAVLLISLGITLSIALVWGAVMAMKISSTDFSFVDQSVVKNMPGFKESFSNFFDKMSAIFDQPIPTVATDTTAVAE